MPHSRHLLTGSRAFSTHVGAPSTMLHAVLSMFFAFIRTGITNVGTYAAKLIAEPAFHAHYSGSGITDHSTLKIKLDTGLQHFHIFFIQTGHSALVAGGSTSLAGFQALLILLIGHKKCITG
nr:hypothetical protein [Chitinophaga sp. GbtcB8]